MLSFELFVFELANGLRGLGLRAHRDASRLGCWLRLWFLVHGPRELILVFFLIGLLVRRIEVELLILLIVFDE